MKPYRREYLAEALQKAEDIQKKSLIKALFGALPWAALPRRTRRARADLLTSRDSYLKTSGWLISRRDKASVDQLGRPLPWFTYASVHFLESRITQEMTIFEYGSGASTLWWAARVKSVVACESNEDWYHQMRGIVPQNTKMILARDTATYAHQILDSRDYFDLVVIDGESRVDCARRCVERLTSSGVIVWDNSDRKEYQEGYDFLVSRNFRRLDFRSMVPINVNEGCTSVFYRAENCLGI